MARIGRVVTGLFGAAPDATPIDPDGAAGLIPDWIATQRDLNSAEQENILAARTWAFDPRRRWTPETLLTADTVRALHRRMLSDVWTWAGTWRRRQTNIGVEPWQIAAAVHDLCADVAAQIADSGESAWPPDEIAVRFHYRLVVLHPFVNGNGRHARLAADLLIVTLGRPPFGWGATGGGREAYLAALRETDRTGDLGALLAFARA